MSNPHSSTCVDEMKRYALSKRDIMKTNRNRFLPEVNSQALIQP